MKILNQPIYGDFKKKLPEQTGTGRREGVQSGAVTDKNSIRHGTTSVSDKQLLLLKSSVQSYISAPASKERLDAIRDGIQKGTYNIPSADLAAAILSDEI